MLSHGCSSMHTNGVNLDECFNISCNVSHSSPCGVHKGALKSGIGGPPRASVQQNPAKYCTVKMMACISEVKSAADTLYALAFLLVGDPRLRRNAAVSNLKIRTIGFSVSYTADTIGSMSPRLNRVTIFSKDEISRYLWII